MSVSFLFCEIETHPTTTTTGTSTLELGNFIGRTTTSGWFRQLHTDHLTPALSLWHKNKKNVRSLGTNGWRKGETQKKSLKFIFIDLFLQFITCASEAIAKWNVDVNGECAVDIENHFHRLAHRLIQLSTSLYQWREIVTGGANRPHPEKFPQKI